MVRCNCSKIMGSCSFHCLPQGVPYLKPLIYIYRHCRIHPLEYICIYIGIQKIRVLLLLKGGKVASATSASSLVHVRESRMWVGLMKPANLPRQAAM